MVDVSVIIPVYNTKEEYLTECFDSIVDQTFSNYEVIIVNDGSDKKTTEFLGKSIKNLNNWRVISQNNTGVSVARNNGLKSAKGEYVLFLDADDIFRQEFFLKLYSTAKQNNSDIVTCWFDYYDDKTKQINYLENLNTAVISKLEDKSNFCWKDIPDSIFSIAAPNPWTKLYRREFLIENKLQFNKNLFRAQDLDFYCRSIICAKVISVIEDHLILYRSNTGTSNTDKRLYPLASFEAMVCVKRFLKSKNLYNKLKRSFSERAVGAIWFHLRNTDKEFVDDYDKIHNFLLDLSANIVEDCNIEDTKLVYKHAKSAEYFREKLEIIQGRNQSLQENINNLEKETTRLNNEVSSYSSVRRSARLFLGNVARRLHIRSNIF